jgi:predicted phosphodiesterase
MRIGLVTDIHGDGDGLARALERFRDHRVDQVVTIGDTCDAFGRGDGAGVVTASLEGCGAVGVWGNHDFTLCRDVPAEVRHRCPPGVLEFMGRMRPRLVVGDCHFSHRESSVDPHDVSQLWDLGDGPTDLMERAALAFAAVDGRLQFVGHYHRWWAATPEGPVGWSGDGPLRFEPGRRYFVVVAAVCDGWCGILDTEQGSLMPLPCGPANSSGAAEGGGASAFPDV